MSPTYRQTTVRRHQPRNYRPWRVFWVLEHPRNFRQKFDAEKCGLKLIIMSKAFSHYNKLNAKLTTMSI